MVGGVLITAIQSVNSEKTPVDALNFVPRPRRSYRKYTGFNFIFFMDRHAKTNLYGSCMLFTIFWLYGCTKLLYMVNRYFWNFKTAQSSHVTKQCSIFVFVLMFSKNRMYFQYNSWLNVNIQVLHRKRRKYNLWFRFTYVFINSMSL